MAEPDRPARMPVWASRDKIRTHWLGFLCGIDLLYGLLTVFSRSDGAAQALLRSVVPIATPLWGAGLAWAAVMVLFGWSVIGGVAGTLAWGVLGGAALLSIIKGGALSYTGPILPLAFAGFHWLIAFEVGSGLDVDRERRQRR